MSSEPHSFKQLVLGLQPGAHDRTMQLAIELADLLHLDLLGLFLEDTSLLDLARIPFSREFRPLGGGWHPIDLEQLLHDFEFAARSIEHKFKGAAKRLSTGYQFETARGSPAKTFAFSRRDDIIMIVEPQNPVERATQQFAWLLEAAFRSAAAVMLVPPHIARTKGPVVAIAASASDPCVLAAAAIALAAKEELVIINTDGGDTDDPDIRKLVADTGLSIKHVTAASPQTIRSSGLCAGFPPDSGTADCPDPQRLCRSGGLRDCRSAAGSCAGRRTRASRGR